MEFKELIQEATTPTRRGFLKFSGGAGLGFLVPKWLQRMLDDGEAVINPEGVVEKRKIVVPVPGHRILERVTIVSEFGGNYHHKTATRAYFTTYFKGLEEKGILRPVYSPFNRTVQMMNNGIPSYQGSMPSSEFVIHGWKEGRA